MKNVNILTSVEHLQPGDNFTDHSGEQFVLYANESVTDDPHSRRLRIIAIKDGAMRPTSWTLLSQTRFVTERPQ